MYMYIHGTPLVAFVKKRADISVDLHSEKTESVEKRPDGSQRANVSAKWLTHKDGESHQGEEDEKLDIEQSPHACHNTPPFREDIAARIP